MACGRGHAPHGANETKTARTTDWKSEGKARIDVENPNPGQRAGQIHYQDTNNTKYYYQVSSNTFSIDPAGVTPAPRAVQRLLDDPSFSSGVSKAMRYLGEK